jgi:hypothetical protein
MRRMRFLTLGLALFASVAPSFIFAQTIDAVVAHPPFSSLYKCSEHARGELKGLGDELGQDCVVEGFVEDGGRLWARAYKTDGRENEDWFGWDQPVLSPCACNVIRIQENPSRTNLVSPESRLHLSSFYGAMMVCIFCSPTFKVSRFKLAKRSATDSPSRE